MVFVDIEDMYTEILKVKNLKMIPRCIRNLYINYIIKKIIKTYELSLDDVFINYDIIKDFSVFYLNTIGHTNSSVGYKLLRNKISRVDILENAVVVDLDYRCEKLSYHLTFRNDDNSILIKEMKQSKVKDGISFKTFNRDFSNSYTLSDKKIDTILKGEMIKYISYYLKTYAFM